MRKRMTGTFLTVLMFSLVYTLVSPINVHAVVPTTKIYIDPPQIIDETMLPNDTFTISIKVENIPEDPGLVGLQLKISWNSSLLNGVSMEEVLFHSVAPPDEQGNIWRLEHNVKAGYVEYAYTWQNITRAIEQGYAPISGNHTVAIITLKVKGIGKTIIDLLNTKLGAPAGQRIPHEAFDGYFQNTPPPPPAQLYVDPPKILDLNLTPSKNFTININIANATDVYTLEFKLGFDTNILYANMVERGDFIPPSVTPNIVINNTAGFIWLKASLGASLSGNGTLTTITFHVEGLGGTTLDLYDTQLLDMFGQPLPHEAFDGSFNNILLAKLAVEPQETIDPSLLPPSTFTINVTIADVEDLYGYEFNLTFNPNVIVCLQVEIHDVLNETNYIPNQFINNVEGFIIINVTYYPPANPLNIYPPTPLVTAKFRVKAIGTSNLTLRNTKLVDSAGQPIPHEAYSGYFQSLIRDIAVIDVFPFPTEIYQGLEINITVTVKNEGNITETFSINVYYDSTLIAMVNVTDLAPNENTTVNVTWDTDGVQPGNYTIWAEAPSIPYEIDTTNNVLIDGAVKVKIPGDINGDDIVDIYDALFASSAFGSYLGDPQWNPACDLNGDNIVDIFDIIMLASNFGRRI